MVGWRGEAATDAQGSGARDVADLPPVWKLRVPDR
jgi:hypothetical protein